MEMQERLRRIRVEALALGVDVLITSNQANIRYATGFRGEPHTLFLTAEEAVLYTSFRTLSWAESQTAGLQAELELSTASSPMDDIVQRLGDDGAKIGVDQGLLLVGASLLD
ncbi:aminopeptidase P family N-terminal domain-containing protein [bacterium]|nr:aminopeptidase P family N-terminal domain-containing protein [bacterium]